MRLGIDFGTCYSSAALLTADGRLERVKNPSTNSYSIPSSIYVQPDGQVLVGTDADNRRRRDPSAYRREFKRELGSPTPIHVGSRSLLPEEMVAEVLRLLKREAEAIAGTALSSLTLTIPATFHKDRRDRMKRAAALAGFAEDEVRLLEEPVAAALHYTAIRPEALKDGEFLLFYDLGGGTFDAALLRKKGGSFEVIGEPRGVAECGGVDFDREIAQDLLRKAEDPQIREKVNPQRQDKDSRVARLMLAEFCSGIKHGLTQALHAENDLYLPGDIVEYQLSRAEFDQMIQPYLEETVECCQGIARDAGLEWERVAGVLLVGGSSRIPYVQEFVTAAFGRPVLRVDDPELAVCQGAARYLHMPLATSVARTALPTGASAVAIGHSLVAPAPGPELTPAPEQVRPPQPACALRQHTPTTPTTVPDHDGLHVDSGAMGTPIKIETTLAHSLSDHTGIVVSIVFSPDGEFLATASKGGPILLWSPDTGALVRSLTPGLVGFINGRPLAFSADGRVLAHGWYRPKLAAVAAGPYLGLAARLLGANMDVHLIRLVDPRTGTNVYALNGHTKSVTAVAFSRDGEIVISAGDDGEVRVWDSATGKSLSNVSFPHSTVSSIALSADGTIAASGGANTRVWLRRPNAELGGWEKLDHGSCVACVAFSPDGKLLASGGYDGVVRLWNPESGDLLHSLLQPSKWAKSVAFSPDSRLLAISSYECVNGRTRGINSVVTLWNSREGKLLHTVAQYPEEKVQAVAFSPDGSLLAAAVGKEVMVWSVKGPG